MTPEIEKIIFDDFRNLLDNFPRGHFYKSESPDFIVEKENGKLGIELTEIFQDSDKGNSNYQRRLSDRHSLTSLLIKELQKNVNFTFHVNIHYSDFYHIKKSKKHEIANKLFEICFYNLRELENQKNFMIDDFRILPKEVNSIRIGRYDGLNESFDEMPEGGVVSKMTDLHLYPLIRQKDEKISNYQKCNEYWLVIREGNYYAGTFSEIELNMPVSSQFDKVFLLRTGERLILELK